MRPQVIQKIKYGIVIMFFFVLGMLVITTSHHVFSPKAYMEYNMCRVGSIVSSPLIPFNRTHGGTLFHTQIGGLGDQLFQWAYVIRKKARPFRRTSSGVRFCWELQKPKEPKGPKGPTGFELELSEVHLYRGNSLIRKRLLLVWPRQ